MQENTQIKLFEEKKVRSVWNDKEQQWYFVVVDVIEILTDSKNPTKYVDDTDVNAPTEDVVQVNTYNPSTMNEQVLQQQTTGNKQNISQPAQPPIPTAGQDFHN